ncbi:MAG: L,D-transpeptidase [Sphingomonadales bacterium]|nr:MAG: L,D-transpeptidase [Sphingomonadales bacterium]
MRAGLIGALLITVAVIAGVFIGNHIIAAAPTDGGARLAAARSVERAARSDGARDYLAPAELDAATRSKILPAGTKSLLKTDGKMRHGDYTWRDKGVPPGKVTIWVDLRTQLISVFRGGHEIGASVIVYGAEDMQSPVGRFPILSKQRDYHSRAYDAPMPYSLFITDTGVALHGSPMSSRRATHGCIGLPEEFARLVFDAAETGDEVQIVRSQGRASTVTSKRAVS